MRKILTFSCILLLFVCLAAASLTASAASAKVVYIADSGNGNGSSASSPLGNASGYSTWASDAYQYSSLNRAIQQIKDDSNCTEGIVVICGPVTLKWGKGESGLSEVPIGPGTGTTTKNITITSKYNNVDYRSTKGAALILERTYTQRLALEMKCPSTWKDITIRANHAAVNGTCLDGTFTFACNGYKAYFETTTAIEAYEGGVQKENTPTNARFFPLLAGGHRYSNLTANTKLTVYGGIWQHICGADIAFDYGYSNNQYGKLTGNVDMTVGGQSRVLNGLSGGSFKNGGSVSGTISMTLTGGTVYGEINLGGAGGVSGSSNATLYVKGGNLNSVTAINDIPATAGWNAPANVYIDCTQLKDNGGLTAMQRAETLYGKITRASVFTFPDSSTRSLNKTADVIPSSITNRLSTTPYSYQRYMEVYNAILSGSKEYNVVTLINMLRTAQNNKVDGFNVPANTDILRKNAVSYFNQLATIPWIAKSTMDYTKEETFTTHLLYEKGVTYYGLPYTADRKPSATISEFSTYLNGKTYEGPTDYDYLIGIDCGAPRLTWGYSGALCNTDLTDFQLSINYNAATNEIIDTVGSYDVSKFTSPNQQDTYTYVCMANGVVAMFDAYAAVRPADYIVKRFYVIGNTGTAPTQADQHLCMAVDNAVVVRNANGEVSGSKSYLILSEQTSTVSTVDGKQTTWVLNQKVSFDSLFREGYIPLTTKTLKSETVEAPYINFRTNGYSGINLVGHGTITSNYNILEVRAVIRNQSTGAIVKDITSYPYRCEYHLANSLAKTPAGGSVADTSRDNGMSSLDDYALNELPSGSYSCEVIATIGFGSKTVTKFDFTK